MTAAPSAAEGGPPLVVADGDGAILRLHVQPGAAVEGLVGFHGGALKVKVRAPATSGRANEAVLRLLARDLALPRAGASVVSGAASRDKRVRFAGVAPAELRQRVLSALGG